MITMSQLISLNILLAVLAACSPVNRSESKPGDDIISKLQAKQAERIDEYLTLSQNDQGWLVTDCDGALWSYTAAAFAGCPVIFNPRASEYPGEPGRLSRTPAKLCWDQENQKDNGSKTNWSGDMGKAVITYAWVCNDLPLLEDHASYGFNNKWIMSDGDEGYLLERSFYRPGFRGELYSTIYALGGEDDNARLWPNTYTSGLKDYQAHLQVLSIWLRSDMRHSASGDAVPADPDAKAFFHALNISKTMFERLKEHAERDPKDPYFQAVYALYSGDFDRAVDLCLKDYAPTDYVGEYVRCDKQESCQLAHLIKACGVLIRGYSE